MIRIFIALGLMLGMTSAQAVPADDLDCTQCVQQGDIAPKSVSSGKLQNGAVTRIKLAEKSVTAAKIAGSAVTQGKIKDQAVTTIKLRDGAVTLDKLSPDIAAMLTNMQATVDSMEAYVNQLQAYIEIDETTFPSQPVVRIVAANLQVVNGSDATANINGTGNLIIGYDETDASALTVCTYGAFLDQASCEAAEETWGNNHKSGSHNLIIGPGHSYSQFGGLVAGHTNVVNFFHSSVTGGQYNTAAGPYSSVSGGQYNIASQYYSSVSGGMYNTASGQFSSVSGGYSNTASGEASSVSGGSSRSAPAIYDWAAGSLFETN
jgi:hypothetical protein